MTPTITTAPFSGLSQLAGTRQFTVGEYHRLIDTGILGKYDKVELLEGYVVYKADYPELQPTDTAFPQWRALRPWTSAEYHKMLDLGIIDREEKLELLDGYLVLKMSQYRPHRAASTRLVHRLPGRLPVGWLLVANYPIALGVMDPEPDGMVLRGNMTDYDARDPVATDVGIVIEVSDATLEMDRAGKGRLFAKFGLPVFWIINVEDRQIEVYTDPDATANPPAYRTRTDYRPGQDVPVALDGAVVAVLPASDLIP